MPRTGRLKKKAKKSTLEVVKVPSNVNDAIQYLEVENGHIRRENLLAAIKILSETASSTGLTAELLGRLVDIIGSAKFTDVVNRNLIGCLIPNIRIPDDAIISALSWICTKNLRVSSQKLLTQWIVAAFHYDVVDRSDRLPKLYHVVFLLLQYEDLCPYACHLLFLLTRKEDITISHVRKLISLQSKVGSQPYILGLLNLYHQFRPDLVAIQPRPLKYFRSLKRWHLLAEVPSQVVSTSKLAVLQGAGSRLRKRARVLYYQNLVSAINETDNFLTVLKSPDRRILISSCEDIIMKFKLHFMLEIEDEWFGKYRPTNTTPGVLLKTLADVYTETRENLDTAEMVLGRIFNTWDGSRFYEEVLRIIPHLDMCTFHELKTLVLDTLQTLFVSSPVAFQLATIQCLSCLFQNWVLFKYNLTEDTVSHSRVATNDSSWALYKLALHIDNLCILGSMQHPENEDRFHFAGLDFYSVVLHLIDLGYLDLLIVPSSAIVFGSLFAFSASRLSQLCLVIARYKTAIQKLRNIRSNRNTLVLGIKTLNSFITDMCNTLWRCKGFVPSPASVIYDDKLPPSVLDTVEEPHTLFAAYRHPALVVSNTEFLRKSGDVRLEPRDIMTVATVRGAFMQHLSSCNYSGIIAFIQTFIKLRSQV